MSSPAARPHDDDDEDMNYETMQYYRNGQNLRFTLISREEEKDLFRRSLAGDESAREFLITNHLLFAMTYARAHGKGLQDDELVSAANLALMTAIDRFDPKWDNRFTSFLKPFIKGELAQLWRSKNIVSSPRNTIPPTTLYLEDLTPSDLSQHGDAEITDGGHPDHGVLSASNEFDFDSIDNRARLEVIWRAAKKVLTKNEYLIFEGVYRDGKSYSDIGRDRNVTREAIRISHCKGMQKLIAELRRRGLR